MGYVALSKSNNNVVNKHFFIDAVDMSDECLFGFSSFHTCLIVDEPIVL
jgi:hypothetical protein